MNKRAGAAFLSTSSILWFIYTILETAFSLAFSQPAYYSGLQNGPGGRNLQQQKRNVTRMISLILAEKIFSLFLIMFMGYAVVHWGLLHAEDSFIFLPYGCMVDEFQHIMYQQPDLTPDERNAVWLELEKKYRPWNKFGDLPFYGRGAGWQRQLHIFECPFYYIDYCLASVCAMQFKVMMDEDFEKAWKNYYKLCNLSARDFFTNVIVEAGLNSPFEDGCMEKLVDKFEKKAFNR